MENREGDYVMKILRIVTNTGATFTVAEPIDPDGSPIESISYEKFAYNKGFQGDFPAYVLRFVDVDIRQVIRADSVDIFVVDPEKDKKKEETVPDLPEGANNDG